MNCQHCQTDVKEWDKRQGNHLTATESLDGHVHVHGPFEKTEQMRRLVRAVNEEVGMDKMLQTSLPFNEVIFHNRQRIGDMLMFTCAVRDFKAAYPHIKVNVISTCGHIWDHNPHVDRTLQPFYKDGVTLETAKPEDLLEGRTNVLKIGPSKGTNQSNRIDWHFANAFRISIEDQLGIKIQQGESRPDIWLTEDEYNSLRITPKPYWIIVTGGEKGWGCKMYPTSRWQRVIDANPDILFYQLGAASDNHERLKGANVVDYIGKTESRDTGIRDLFKLFLHSEGSIGLVSFHMHLSGALNKPSVVVAGAREPVSFTRYAGHQYIANDGCLPCATTACWKCDIKACTNLVTVEDELMPRCVDMISPDDVTSYLRRYYDGGRLSKTVPIAKPKLKNIVKVAAATPVPVATSTVNTYGLTFNGGALTERDWEFIKATFQKYNVKSLVEFGAGLSTLLINDTLPKVVTYEDKQGWIDKLVALRQGLDIRLWDGKTLETSERYDMAFVDGPAGDFGREASTKLGAQMADVVIVHDAGREWARKYQQQYLDGVFDGPVKGGHRCHLWTRKAAKMVAVDKKTIRFVFNGRGEGGAETTSTWIMNKLAAMGHDVVYHSPNPAPCGTFRKTGSKDVRFESMDNVQEPCDVLVLYANDWIWEFPKAHMAERFSHLNTTKKILAVNYKLDKIGTVDWTRGWDRYLLLNSDYKKVLLERHPEASVRVMAPPIDIERFLKIQPDYSGNLRLIRHSSQGDSKFPKDYNELIGQLLESREDATLRLMPAPTFMQPHERVIPHLRNQPAVSDYLQLGNCFIYNLPKGYTEGGPKVVMEAQAAGLAVFADNHSGMKDRVVEGTGKLCNTPEDYLIAIESATPENLRTWGEAARAHAKSEYDPMNWIREITS